MKYNTLLRGWRKRLQATWATRRQRPARRCLNDCATVSIEALETRALLTAHPIAQQFLVDENVALEESAPAVAVAETSGRVFAAWTGFGQPGGDESGLGVYARRFLASGAPDGDAFLVNSTFTHGDQFAPAIAVDAAENFVVAWESHGQDTDGAGIYAQRYWADGTANGQPFQVNEFTTGNQTAPTVAMDNAGHLLIAWQSEAQDGNGTDIYARRFAPDGTPLEPEEYLVNTTVIGHQAAPTAAMARESGNFVIAWEGELTAEHTSFEVFAHLYDADAHSIRSEFLVNSGTAKDQVTAEVAMDADGDFVVTWTSEGIPGSGSDVFARRFDPLGNPSDGEFRVNETTLQGQRSPAVTMNGNGDFFVGWQSSHQDEFSWGIFGRAYDASGTVLTTEQQINSFAEQPQVHPALGSNADGQCVALWLGLDENHTPAVHAQRYQLPRPGNDFSRVGDEMILANYGELEETSAAAAVAADRSSVVVWQSYGNDGSGLGIMGRRLDANGTSLANAFQVNMTTSGNQSNPDVASDAEGNFVVTWQSDDVSGTGHDIFAQRFDTVGNQVGAEFQVNTVGLGHQTMPTVCMNAATGNFVIAWQGPDASGAGIYAQRFDAMGNPLGTEFQVNTHTYLDQVSPEVAMNTAGEFAVVWVSDHRAEFDLDDDSEKSIFVQWYDANGNYTGDEQLVHTIDKDYQAQEYPDVAIDTYGNLTVVWQSITQDGSAWGVYGRQLLPDKTPVQPAEFPINQTTAENQRRATVACDPDGNFTVSWQSDLQDQSATAIVSRQFHADATPETDEMIVNTWELGPQILPVVAMTPSGDFGVFWLGQGTSRSEGIHGRIYEEGYEPPLPHISVTPVGDQFLVSEAAGLEQSNPAVAVIELSADYVTAWTSFEQPGGDESGLGVYAQRFAADGTPQGDAVLVNSAYTADDQTNPVVAVAEDGRFIVVWQSLRQDRDGFGIYAQRFANDGLAVGAPFRVNERTAGNQEDPTVAMDNDGNFVIAWQSEGDGDGYGIYARRYAADGRALETAELLVNTTTEGNQTAPSAARARVDGQFVISWQSEVLADERVSRGAGRYVGAGRYDVKGESQVEGESDIEVLAQLFNADGSTLGGEFTVNTIGAHDQVAPSAAMGPGGDFVITWTSEGQMGSGADVFARRFDDTGSGLEDDFRVNMTTQQKQQNSVVGMDAAGNFQITWQSGHQDGFSWGIYAQVYDPSGEVMVNEFLVNTNTQGPQINPAVSVNSEGEAVVAWLGLDATHKSAVHAQRFLMPAAGFDFVVAAEGEVVLNNYIALEESPASAAADENGNYVVTWQSYGEDGSGLGVFARRFDAAGEPVGDPFPVTTTTTGNQSHPDVAMDYTGNFVIVWQSAALDEDENGYDIFAQRFDASGGAIGSEFQVNTTVAGNQGLPAAAMNPETGTVVIIWQGPDAEGLGIFGQRYQADGSSLGNEFQVNAFSALDQVNPTVSINTAGEFVVGWVSDHRAVTDPTDTEKSIFVQWYDPEGQAVGDEVLAHSIQPEFEAQEHPDVAIDSDGDFALCLAID